MSDYTKVSSAPSELRMNFSHANAYLNAQTQETNQFEIYKTRLENYQLQHKATKQQTHKSIPENIKLNEVTKDLKGMLESIRQLKNVRNQLEQMLVDTPANDWQMALEQTSKHKTKVMSILSKYENETVQQHVKNAINKRRVKRANVKKSKEKRKQTRRSDQLARAEKHKQVDLWLSENERKISDQRMRSEDADRAELILAGVTKKKLETKKYLSLFDSLIELRRVRHVQSGKATTGAEEFNRKIADLKRIWVDALHNYDLEENELKQFLDSRSGQGFLKEWCKVLFGLSSLDENANRNNPMLKADYNVKELIRIRNLWDQCLVSNEQTFGSNIPLGWVTPNENPSDQWKVYVQTD